MLPTISIVGRPNVGKSTLFNRLTRTRDALVGKLPGLTRDRQYGEGMFDNQRFIVVDTGGMEIEYGEVTGSQKKIRPSKEKATAIETLMSKQALQAILEADVVLFLVDARAGLMAQDEALAQILRRHNKKVYLVANKIDGLDAALATTEFHKLGLGAPYPIAAEHGIGVGNLITEVLESLPEAASDAEIEASEQEKAIKIAFIGKPNVGKSTLINRLLGEERVIVYDKPGTTRDSIFMPFTRHNKNYILIDTAGVRRKSKVKGTSEKFSVIKTLQAIEAANVVVLLIDAKENIAEQDLRLLSFAIDAGKALVIAVNKWDDLAKEARVRVRQDLNWRLSFINFAKIHFISALKGKGMGGLFTSIDKAYQSATRKLDTPTLTRILQAAVSKQAPPYARGKRIKLRYAHAGGQNPPLIIIHGNQVKAIPAVYRRYLAATFQKALGLQGTPVKVEFRAGKNPYAKTC